MSIEFITTICLTDQSNSIIPRWAMVPSLIGKHVKERLLIWLRSASNRMGKWFVAEKYQPEEHYMRGPGPKTARKLQNWRADNDTPK